MPAVTPNPSSPSDAGKPATRRSSWAEAAAAADAAKPASTLPAPTRRPARPPVTAQPQGGQPDPAGTPRCPGRHFRRAAVVRARGNPRLPPQPSHHRRRHRRHPHARLHQLAGPVCPRAEAPARRRLPRRHLQHDRRCLEHGPRREAARGGRTGPPDLPPAAGQLQHRRAEPQGRHRQDLHHRGRGPDPRRIPRRRALRHRRQPGLRRPRGARPGRGHLPAVQPADHHGPAQEHRIRRLPHRPGPLHAPRRPAAPDRGGAGPGGLRLADRRRVPADPQAHLRATTPWP